MEAPDGQTVAYVGQHELQVRRGGRYLIPPGSFGVETLAELLWAPDSSALLLTQSEGGHVGNWQVVLLQLDEGAVTRFDVAAAAVGAFKKHYSCVGPEEPNVGAVAWVKGSEQVLLALEVPPHSSCPQMGMLRGYLVQVPSGQIVEELAEPELRRRWGGSLGLRLAAEPSSRIAGTR